MIISTLALVIGFTLTVLSFFEMCTSACVEGHKFRIFSLKFEHFGLIFFSGLLLSHFLGFFYPFFSALTGYLLAAAMGAEVYFIYIQKFIIGNLCPLCLGIAFSLAVAAGAYFYKYLKKSILTYKEGITMGNSIKKGLSGFTALFFGFILAFTGTHKINASEELQTTLKDSITFGDSTSPIEVYVFTDWFCPACLVTEGDIEKVAPKIEKIAKLYFIDAFIHDESMNFIPYNLSFMVNNKPVYFELRNALIKLAENTKSPSETQVQMAIKPYGVTYKEMSYRDIAIAAKMFRTLKKQFAITGTPAIVVINTKTKKGKKLIGTSDITETKIMDAINTLKG